jgi:DNA polymerase III subunit chi
MTEILFYHLERARLENILPDLLQKSLQNKWRAVLRVGSKEKLEALDDLLWRYNDESFLPHGYSGDTGDHPIWLTIGDDLPDRREILFVVEGADFSLAEIENLTRCVLIFDGGDSDQLEKARTSWKQIKDSRHDATYWRQNTNGRWEKAA